MMPENMPKFIRECEKVAWLREERKAMQCKD